MSLTRRQLAIEMPRLMLGAFGLAVGAVSGNATTATSKRLVHICLYGGMTPFWGADPPITGDRASSPNFQDLYRQQSAVSVSGKDQLLVGEGLSAAAPAFAGMSTCFINGLDARQAIHGIGHRYALSGVLSFSRGRESPALAAALGNSAGGFPPHVVFGSPIPLGSTALSAPPLIVGGGLSNILQPPMAGSRAARVATTLSKFNDLHFERLSPTEQAAVASWRAISESLQAFDARDFGTQLAVSNELAARYGSSSSGLASAYLALKTGLCSYLTLPGSVPDSHFDEAAQLASQKSFAQQLNLFVEDLKATADPDDSSRMLSDTTTIIINAEFGRSPLYNANGGTDHWDTTSVILMGQFVRDNTIIGSSGTDGKALGWENGATVVKTADNALLIEQVFASILSKFERETEASVMSDKRLDEAFT